VNAQVDDLLARCRARLPRRPRPEELDGLLERGALVVDIRPQALRERDGDIPGALVVERNQLEWRLDPTSEHSVAEATDAERPIVLVCDEGYASSLAAASLQDIGLRNATDLDGGFQAWRVVNPRA
jgi:rhodanese-related sulfurtransferase